MLNQSADYALRAVLLLARSAGRNSRSAEAVATALGVPRNYMGKVLNTLARAGVLSSVRGPRGGFRLAHDPAQLTIETVIEPFQRLAERSVCLLGDRPCDSTNPCDVHTRWRRMAEPVTAFFRNTTIAALLDSARTARPSGAPSAAFMHATARVEGAAAQEHPIMEAYR